MGNKPSKRYNCDPCDYHVQKTSIWNRHLKSRKHQNKIKVLNPVVLINNCIECNIEFSYYSENKKCWTCKIKYIIFLEYKECDKKRGNFCKKDDCLFCFNRSFVSCDKHKYLDPADEIDPRQIEKHAHKIGHFNCIKCFHKFKLEIRYASMDHWCQYCNKKICKNNNCIPCYNKSFASHFRSIDWDYKKNKLKPRDVSKMSNSKYWFNCKICLHLFDITLSYVSYNRHWCRYCAHQDLCEEDCKFCFNNSFALHPLSIYWSKKNIKLPRKVFLNARAKYWFDCFDCKEKFLVSPSDINHKCSWCPYCKNKTETKFKKWFNLTFKNYKLIHQIKFEWCKNINCLPFDFGIENFNLIFEIDGPQHFIQISNWKCPRLTQKRDIYKMKQALKNNKTVIRISQEDIWYDRYDWKEDNTIHQKTI